MTLRWELRSRRATALAVVLVVLVPPVAIASGLCPMMFFDEDDVIGTHVAHDFTVVGNKAITLYWAMVQCDSLGDPLLFCMNDTLGIVPADENCVGKPLPIDERDAPDFGGYRVWSREAWRLDEFDLAHEYVFGEDDTLASGYWSFEPFYEDSIKTFVATPVQNAFPYEFSVTAFKMSVPESVNYDCLEANRTGVMYPIGGIKNDLAYVQVIPNPYRDSADWEHGGQRRVTFVGLPAGRTIIRIYTTAADLVRTLIHESPDSDQEFWDLKTHNGDEVAPGVYIWAVEALGAEVEPDTYVGGLGTAQGRVMVIK